jgi:hypothetical protein
MKKTYQMPTIKWLEADTEEMIASSPLENGFKMDEVDTTNETSGNLSRKGYSVWDDEDE